VCIPAYNEESVIGLVVQNCLKYSDKVIVCDDGSTDQTATNAENAGATVLRNSTNKGKGAAMKQLFDFAKNSEADVIITIDGDGQFLPEEIDKLAKPIIEKSADIVIGYRFQNNDEMPFYRKLGNKFFDKVTSMASELPFRDTQSGFRSYSKKAIDLISFNSNGFAVDSEILINASKKDLKITEEKITVLYNLGTKTSTKHPISHSGDILSSLIEIIAIRHPLKYLGLPGIILFLVGIIYSIVVVIIFNDIRYFSIPSTLVALGSLLIGLMMVLMSVVLFSINRAMPRIR
jgi:glycosyltransferase involved in cell wall biosynthesis